MKKIPVNFFDDTPNVGDLLNSYLIEAISNRDVVKATNLTSPHLLGVGSIMGKANENSIIWGTGVIGENRNIKNISPNNILAVRGENTVLELKKNNIFCSDEVVLGDPGYLISDFYNKYVETVSGRIGIVAHYKDREMYWFKKLKFNNYFFDVDVRQNVESFIDDLRSCEVIISSSLHGLIFSESYGIPNAWVNISNKVAGNGFKFYDWMTTCQSFPYKFPFSKDEKVLNIAKEARLHNCNINSESLIKSFFKAIKLLDEQV